jgi:DNA-binding SARP family transcriptional activator
MRSTLLIYTLGQLETRLNGRSFTTASRKAQALLVYLACQQRPAARETATALLWEESGTEQGMTNLRKLLFELRQLLPEHLQVERQTVGLTADFWLDATALAELAAVGGVDEMETAVNLYNGPFLAGFDLPDCPEFMLWVAMRREQAQQVVGRMLRQLTTHCLHQRRYKDGVGYARRLVDLEPFSEEACRRLMLLLARNGRPEKAAAAYERCRRLLAAELGVAPTEATEALLARIQTAAQPPTLPPQTTSFVGRERELAQLNQLLADPDGRWLTIVGPGGVGKTRLALQIAHEWRCDFLHGVYFVSLTAVDSPAAFYERLAAVLKLPHDGRQPTQAQLLVYLQTKELALTLDDGDILLTPPMFEAADFLLEVLRQAPQVRLLATSRQRFDYRVERVLVLSGLPLTEEAAARLFIERARERLPQFQANDQELAAIRQICRLVDGLPLALELAASQLANHSPQQIASALAQTLDFLQDDAYPDRHNSLRAVFETTWERLTPDEQIVLARIASFADGFTATDADDVSHFTLLSLVDKSALRLVDGRYFAHPVLGQFAAERLLV